MDRYETDTTSRGGRGWNEEDPAHPTLQSGMLFCSKAAILLEMGRAETHTVTIQERGVVAIPAEFRRRHNLNPGDRLQLIEFEDGHLELVPLAEVPASQVWFWSERWQNLEREVDEHVARGEEQIFDDTDSFLDHIAGIESSD